MSFSATPLTKRAGNTRCPGLRALTATGAAKRPRGKSSPSSWRDEVVIDKMAPRDAVTWGARELDAIRQENMRPIA